MTSTHVEHHHPENAGSPSASIASGDSGWQWWTRTVIEFIIGIGTVLTGVFALMISQNIAAADNQDRDLARVATDNAIRDEQDLSRQQIRVEVMKTWLPELVNGDDPLAARRMIVGLIPGQAEQALTATFEGYRAAGLLDGELEERLNGAIQAASRASAQTSEFAVEVSGGANADEAAAVEADLIDGGLSNVEILQRDADFVVVVRDLDTEQAAERLLPSVIEIVGDAEVSDLSDTPAFGAETLVPSIFEQTEEEALALLAAAGFTDVVVWRIASESVDSGLVRELVLNDGQPANAETEIVDETGILTSSLPADTSLALKISTGPRS